MARIHMILQGKGGVGKSFIAATIAQYKASKGQKPLCIDTDPVNLTFHGYKALGVRRLELMDGEEINSRNFDTLVEIGALRHGASSNPDALRNRGCPSQTAWTTV
jgi:CO dehydrogenase nickel-insertion accessory protein CooC1